jgi:tripartite-type tricarboxylate transporter receptor subunit TctC
MNRFIARSLAVIGIALCQLAPAAAQEWPTRPLRIIVPVPPGGAMDITTRLVAQKMGEKLGQSIIVDNRPGGDTLLGTRMVKDAPADGYTILAQSNGFSSQPALKSDPGYDPLKDFAPLGVMVRGPLIVENGIEAPDKTLKDYIARSKAGNVNYASPGIGTAPHFAAAMMMLKAGLPNTHLPYKGASAAYADLIAGRVGLYFDGYAGSAPYIKSGKFRALAITGPARIPNLPDVPTLVEQGVDVTYLYWLGLIVKAGTPAPVVQKLSDALRYALSTPDLQERFRADGVDPTFMTPAEFTELIRKEVVDVAKLVGELKLAKD